MSQNQDFIIHSLELHLFFARIMKEHAFFLKAGFLPSNGNLIQEAEGFLRQFEHLLSRTITLSDRIVRQRILNAGETVTEFTGLAEQQTQRLTGICIDQTLTARVRRLHGIGCQEELDCPQELTAKVHRLNRDGLRMLDGLISFKERVLRQVNSCHIATANYPLLIEHILREARLYRSCLAQLEECGDYSCTELHNQEPFWNRIMMEHALFIRGLLDPTEEALIATSDQFATDFKRLLAASTAAGKQIMHSCDSGTLQLTKRLRDFKRAGVEGIENCKIRSLILPLLADHVLREANHYIRILEEPS